MFTIRKTLYLLLPAFGVLPLMAQQAKKTVSKATYTLSGAIEGLKESKVYLEATDGDKKLDSVIAHKGHFVFRGNNAEPMFYILKLAGKNGGKGFFLEPGSMTITGHKDSLFNAVITGSVSQQQYEEWSKTWRSITVQAGPIYHRLDSATQHGKVKEPAEERTIFDDGMKSLNAQTYAAVTAFIKKYPQSPVSPFIITDRYINYPDAEKLAAGFALLDEKARQSYYGKQITEYRNIAAKTAVGATPDFTLADTAGHLLKLSSLKGKYVLVDFWASWCGPCRKENPNVVAAYQQYHALGFDIVGVSLDTKKDAWMKAIAKDGLVWNHVSDLKGWESGIVKQFGIRAVPTSFLLDKEGKVIANNLRGEALLEKLGALLQNASGQEKSAMTLSNPKPEAGERLTIVYDPAGTFMQGKEAISITISFFRSDRSRATDVKPDTVITVGKKWTFSIDVPATASAFLIKPDADYVVDANNGNGYTYAICKNGRPVEQSAGSLGLIYSGAAKRAGIKPDSVKALSLMRQELAGWPGLKTAFADTYFSLLFKSPQEGDKKLYDKGMDSLLHAGKESDMGIAMRVYYKTDNKAAADSIVALAREKFPRGEYAMTNYINNSYNEKDPVKKVALYNAIPQKFDAAVIAGNTIGMDYMRNSIAMAYAEAGDVDKGLVYTYKVESRFWRAQAYIGMAQWLLKKNENMDVAAELIKKSIDDAYEFMTTRKNEDGADFAALGYGGYCSMYARLLYDKKDYAGALKYVEVAYANSHKDNPSINETYGLVLSAMGKHQEAMALMEDMIKKGRATSSVKDNLKSVYIKLKGNDAGYDAYLASLQTAMLARVKEDLAKQMISVAAPAFALKDMEGKTVSLSDLKGKIVVVDFWATWCGPCKKSFPAMQLAVNRYKNNPDVVFLFVDTWENVPDASAMVKEFISINKYSFQVLFDTKPAGGEKFVAEKFNVSGIPTKFVIDKNGNIRFRFTGFSGDEAAAVEELSAMIAFASKG